MVDKMLMLCYNWRQLDKENKNKNLTNKNRKGSGTKNKNQKQKEINKNMANAVATQKATFKIPSMSNYDHKKDKFVEAEVNLPNDDGLYDYEAMKGEESYVSPSEASEEALRKIKAMKRSGALARFVFSLH